MRSHPLTILLVTQEDQPRGAMTDVLQDRGFAVDLVRNGRQAIESVRRDRSIAMLVAAMDLADLDGITLAQLAHRLRPELDVLLLCADASELRAAAKFGLYGLMEPVRADLLAAFAGEILGADGEAGRELAEADTPNGAGGAR